MNQTEAVGQDSVPTSGETAEITGDLSAVAVKNAIAGAVEFLRERQLPGGAWKEYPGFNPGSTALCALALLSAGLTKDDPVVAKALNHLRQPLAEAEYQTYTIALMTMVFCLADPIRDRLFIENYTAWLIARQFKTSNIFSGGWSYTGLQPAMDRTDNSNSQFAILALYEAQQIGIPIPKEVWTNAKAYWLRMQNRDGSWGYRASTQVAQSSVSGEGTGSMTCAGIAALVICNEVAMNLGARVEGGAIECCVDLPDETTIAIEKGLKWLSSHFSVRINPSSRNDGKGSDIWLYYYLYGLERVGRLTAQRFIGRNDWYREGTDLLLRRKGPFNKFWKAATVDLKENNSLSTAFALLFLSKGRRPVLISRFVYSGKEATRPVHPNDLQHLTQYVEMRWKRDLIWQEIVAESATAEDLIQTPVLYLGGSDSPLPKEAAQRRKLVSALRGYLEQGGFLLAEDFDGKGDFEPGFLELMKEVFPEEGNQFTLLGADHPIWNLERPIAPSEIRPLLGIDFGCKTSVLFAPAEKGQNPSLSCLWELAARRRSEAGYLPEIELKIASGLDLGLNILAYATNREMKFKEEIQQSVNEEANLSPYKQAVYSAILEQGPGSRCAPRAIPNLMKTIRDEFGIPVETEVKRVTLRSSELFECPVLFLHGRTALRFSEEEKQRLRKYLDRNGFLFANAICGSPQFTQSLQEELLAISPDYELIDVPVDDPIYSNQYGGFTIKELTVKTSQRPEGRKVESALVKRPPTLKGIKKEGRWILLLSPYDVSCALEKSGSIECDGYTPESALQLAANIFLYAIEL